MNIEFIRMVFSKLLEIDDCAMLVVIKLDLGVVERTLFKKDHNILTIYIIIYSKIRNTYQRRPVSNYIDITLYKTF